MKEKNFFSMLDVPVKLALDSKLLEGKFLESQKVMGVKLPLEELNKAFNTLRDPLKRLDYYLEIKGHELAKEAKAKKEEVEEKAEDLKNKAKDKTEELKDKATDLKDKAKDKMEDMKEGAKDLGEKAKDKIDDIKDKSSDLGNKVKGKIEDMKEGAADLKGKAKDKMEDMKDGAKGVMSNITQKYFEIYEEIEAGAKKLIEPVVEKVEGLARKLFAPTLTKLNFSLDSVFKKMDEAEDSKILEDLAIEARYIIRLISNIKEKAGKELMDG